MSTPVVPPHAARHARTNAPLRITVRLSRREYGRVDALIDQLAEVPPPCSLTRYLVVAALEQRRVRLEDDRNRDPASVVELAGDEAGEDLARIDLAGDRDLEVAVGFEVLDLDLQLRRPVRQLDVRSPAGAGAGDE